MAPPMAPRQPFGANIANDRAFLADWAKANLDAEVLTGEIVNTRRSQKTHKHG